MDNSEELRSRESSIAGLRSFGASGSGMEGCETAGDEIARSETVGVSTCFGFVAAGGVGVRLVFEASTGSGVDMVVGGGIGVGGAWLLPAFAGITCFSTWS